MRVVVDGFGSDRAPCPEVAGALRAVRAARASEGAALEVVLVGDVPRLEAILDRLGRTSDDAISLLHAGEVVAMDDHPAQVFRKSDAHAIASAIRAAARFAERALPDQLAAALGALG